MGDIARASFMDYLLKSPTKDYNWLRYSPLLLSAPTLLAQSFSAGESILAIKKVTRLLLLLSDLIQNEIPFPHTGACVDEASRLQALANDRKLTTDPDARAAWSALLDTADHMLLRASRHGIGPELSLERQNDSYAQHMAETDRKLNELMQKTDDLSKILSSR